MVATKVLPGSPGRLLSSILSDTLAVPYSQGGSGIDSVRAVTGTTGRWVVTSKRDTGTSFEVTIYDPLAQAYSIDTIDVRAGDEILFVFLEDGDGDGFARLRFRPDYSPRYRSAICGSHAGPELVRSGR